MNYNQIHRETLPNGFTVSIEHDTDPDSPLNWDNLGTLAILDRSRYNFGDETMTRDEIIQTLNRPDVLALPVYIYDHSGITINTTGFSCPWDSGMIGVIYCTKDKARKEYSRANITKPLAERIRRTLRAEITTMDEYLTGQVYGYRIHDPEGQERATCWGFYGLEHCKEEAHAEAAAMGETCTQ